MIKNPFDSLLHGKMTLMQLLPKVVALEKAVNEKADLARVIDLRKYSMSKQATPPILVDAQKRVKISEHGLLVLKLRLYRVLSYKVSGEAPPRPAKCIRGCAPGTCAREAAASPGADSPAEASASDVYCYDCVPMPPAAHFFFVQFEHGGASMADAADEQPIESAELAALDYGADTSLEDRYTRHIVCEDWCSCNSPAHDGLPCIHMLRLWFQLGLARVPDGAVHRRWAARIGDEEDLCARAARAALPARRAADGAARARSVGRRQEGALAARAVPHAHEQGQGALLGRRARSGDGGGGAQPPQRGADAARGRRPRQAADARAQAGRGRAPQDGRDGGGT